MTEPMGDDSTEEELDGSRICPQIYFLKLEEPRKFTPSAGYTYQDVTRDYTLYVWPKKPFISFMHLVKKNKTPKTNKKTKESICKGEGKNSVYCIQIIFARPRLPKERRATLVTCHCMCLSTFLPKNSLE